MFFTFFVKKLKYREKCRKCYVKLSQFSQKVGKNIANTSCQKIIKIIGTDFKIVEVSQKKH